MRLLVVMMAWAVSSCGALVMPPSPTLGPTSSSKEMANAARGLVRSYVVNERITFCEGQVAKVPVRVHANALLFLGYCTRPDQEVCVWGDNGCSAYVNGCYQVGLREEIHIWHHLPDFTRTLLHEYVHALSWCLYDDADGNHNQEDVWRACRKYLGRRCRLTTTNAQG
jgi:hypothetical protein